MSIVHEWVNPIYLDYHYIEVMRQSMLAKPAIKYLVLDNFFNVEKLDELIEKHQYLQFSEVNDKITSDGEVLPYDGSVVFARQNEHFGSELFFDKEWHNYCRTITNSPITDTDTHIKLRYHRPEADGFWIHTDSATRDIVIICYFNKRWTAKDGGLLQLWRVDEEVSEKAFKVEHPEGRLDFLSNERIQTRTPGGGFPDGGVKDLVLIDQIVPVYNRVFICNLKDSLAYHSVTPSNGKPRMGFVQWLFDRH